MRLLSLLAAAALVASCASRATQVSLAAELARADGLLRQGCYDCLIEAAAVYAGLGPAHRRVVVDRMLEVELLLALREKELAIEATQRLTAAGVLAREVVNPKAAAAVVSLVDSIPADSVGTPRVDRRVPLIVAAPGARDKFLAEAMATIAASGLSTTARDYIEMSLRCGVAPDTVDDGGDAARPPILRYRIATCTTVDAKTVEQVRAEVPRFVETSLFLGRAAMASIGATDGSRPRTLFEEAHARFPESPAITYHLATVAQATGDCRRAEALYGETLTLRDRHEDARLGRAICRTYLSNTEGAIADATILVEATAHNRADALYWRAWNRRTQKQLDLARADVDASRTLRYNARVLTLAGMIEHDQGQFDKAREDLLRARDMDSNECQARWYLGLVGYATEKWPEAAAGFGDAADCYAGRIAGTEALRALMLKRDDVTEEFRARQIAGFDAAIAEDTTQKSAADLNAAINYARAEDIPNATIYMKRAAVDPERRSVVEDLRQVLGVPRW